MSRHTSRTTWTVGLPLGHLSSPLLTVNSWRVFGRPLHSTGATTEGSLGLHGKYKLGARFLSMSTYRLGLGQMWSHLVGRR